VREIKFRAWDKKEKVMDEPFNLYSIGYVNGENGYDAKYYILLQFTGLHDKNGKEIWEGDIVRYYGILPLTLNTHPEGFMEVVYDEGYFGVKDLGTSHGRVANVCFVNPDDWYEVTVVGNIYENPELLKDIENAEPLVEQ